MDQSGDRAAAGFVALPHEAQGLFNLGVVVDLRGLSRRMTQRGRGVVAAHQQGEERRGRVSQLVRRPVLDQVGLRTAFFPHPLVRPFDRAGDVGAVAVLRVVIVVIRLRRFAAQALGAFEPGVPRAEQRFVGLLAAGVPFQDGDLVFPEGDHARLVMYLGFVLEGHINPAVGIPLHELLEGHAEKLGGPHAADPLQDHHIADRGQEVRQRLDDLGVGYFFPRGVFPRLALFERLHKSQPDCDSLADQLVGHAELESVHDVAGQGVDVVAVVVGGEELLAAILQRDGAEILHVGEAVPVAEGFHGRADRVEVGMVTDRIEEFHDQLGDGECDFADRGNRRFGGFAFHRRRADL